MVTAPVAVMCHRHTSLGFTAMSGRGTNPAGAIDITQKSASGEFGYPRLTRLGEGFVLLLLLEDTACDSQTASCGQTSPMSLFFVTVTA